ncbi:MAG: hypothetical protein QM737_16540 [Ferruginibacter sp.]
MKIHYYILLCAVFSITACASSEKKTQAVVKEEKTDIDYRALGLEDLKQSSIMRDILCQSWEYEEDALEAKDVDITSDMEVVYRGYSFFNDGTVTKDPRGNIRTGKWSLKIEKPVTISMEFDHGQQDIKQLAYLRPSEMILSEGEGNDRKKKSLLADEFRHINVKDDPFYPTNVLWRIKPTSPETEKSIRQRLKDCIHFFVLYYEEKINTQAETVTFIGLPTCFTWYSGAVGLQDENQLQRKWINCFYNREQAMTAYKLADKLLRTKLDLPKKESSWLKANLSILKEMEKKVDSIAIDN